MPGTERVLLGSGKGYNIEQPCVTLYMQVTRDAYHLHETQKFQFENQMVCIIPFGVLLKLWVLVKVMHFITPFGIYS